MTVKQTAIKDIFEIIHLALGALLLAVVMTQEDKSNNTYEQARQEIVDCEKDDVAKHEIDEQQCKDCRSDCYSDYFYHGIILCRLAR